MPGVPCHMITQIFRIPIYYHRSVKQHLININKNNVDLGRNMAYTMLDI